MADKKAIYASKEDFKKHIVHYPDVPGAELAPGCFSHIVYGEKLLVSFLTMPAHTVFPIHRHEAEQLMVVVDGYMEEEIEGKLYRVKKGDVIILPSNVPHGGYIGDVTVQAIDIFSPVRTDLVAKAREAFKKAGL